MAAVGGLLLAAAASAQAPSHVQLRPGLLVHPTEDVAYVMTPDSGVAAVSLATGEARWTTGEAQKPLALAGDIVVCLVEPEPGEPNRLGVVALSVGNGEPSARGSIELPEGVRVSAGETLEGTLRTAARATDGGVVVAWRFQPAPERPLRAPMDTLPGRRGEVGTRQARGGALRLNVSTGDLTRADTARAPDIGPPPWVVPPRERISGAPQKQYASADGRHLVASERVADDRSWRKYAWTIYERETEERIGEVRSHVSFTPFVVRDGVLVYETTPFIRAGEGEEPAQLRGMRLRTGEEIWSVAVREIVYRGPFPP